MKKNLIAVMLLSAVSLVFVSCFGGKKTPADAIPADAIFMAKMDVGNILDDSELLKTPEIKDALNAIINATMPRDSREMFRGIVEDPSNSGINVDEAVIMSFSADPFEFVVAMAVSDKERLVNFIETFTESTGVELVEEDGVTRIDFGGRNREADVVFDSDLLVFTACEDGNADATIFMNLASDEQALSDSRCSDFFSEDNDASIFFDSTKAFDMILGQGGMYISDSDKALFEELASYTLSFVMNLNFEKGYAEIDAKLFASDDYMDKYGDLWKDVDGRLLEYVPNNAIGVANFASDYAKMLEKNPDMEKMVLEMMEHYGFTKSMIEDLSGDIMFAVLPAKELGDETLPQMMFAIECDNSALFDNIVEIFGDSELVNVDEDVYALGLNRYYDYYNDDYMSNGYDYYMMYKDNAIFVLPQNIYEKIASGRGIKALSKNATDNECFASLGSKSGVAVDVDAVAAMAKDFAGRISDDEAIAFELLEMFNNAELVAEDATTTRLRVTMDDDSRNVLKQIVDYFVDLVPNLAGVF